MASSFEADLDGGRLAVDRPFRLRVRDRTAGAFVFLGRVVDPSRRASRGDGG